MYTRIHTHTYTPSLGGSRRIWHLETYTSTHTCEPLRATEYFVGNHLSNTTCITKVFFKRGE